VFPRAESILPNGITSQPVRESLSDSAIAGLSGFLTLIHGTHLLDVHRSRRLDRSVLCLQV
jgi:hypothetical protein